MAKEEKVQHEAHGMEKIEVTLSKTEQYIEDNQKTILIVLVALIVVVGGFLAYRSFYVAPREVEAQKAMFAAQQYFEKDSFKLALNGDGNYMGFKYIIDEYGSTKAGNLANYYAAVSSLRLGQFQQALDYIESFSTDDDLLLPISIGIKGDVNMELNKVDEAISFYKKAAAAKSNAFTSPMYLLKAGLALESKGQNKDALELYNRIKTDYSKSETARTIDKYIERATLKAN